MIRRRAVTAGIVARIGNHSFRGTGITTFLLNESSLEMAQKMANHSSPLTTKLYDRRNDRIIQGAIERIRMPSKTSSTNPPAITIRIMTTAFKIIVSLSKSEEDGRRF